MASHLSKVTTNHSQIRRWADARHAHPSCVKGTGGRGDPGILRFDFPVDGPDPNLQEIPWDVWLQAFDDNDLAMVYQERTAAGKRSNFNKLVGRDTVRARERGDSHASRHAAREAGSTRRSTDDGAARRSTTGNGATRRSRTSGTRSTASRSTASRSTGSTGRSATSGARKSTRKTSSAARVQRH